MRREISFVLNGTIHHSSGCAGDMTLLDWLQTSLIYAAPNRVAARVTVGPAQSRLRAPMLKEI